MNITHRARLLIGPALIAMFLVLLAAMLLPAPATSEAPRLASSERGKGEPTLVLIHGIGLDRTLWNRMLPALEQRHKLVLVDLPGHGESPAMHPLTVHDVAEALDRTLRERGIKRAVLVGHSYGGLVALEEAVAHPDRARAVVSIDIGTYLDADSTRLASLEQLLSEREMLFIRGVFQSMTRDTSMVDSVVAMASRVSPVLADYFHDVWRTDLRPRIRTMKQPVLVAATAGTWPPSESWTSARRRLGYETAGPAVGERIYGSSHLGPYDQPDTLAAAILRFTRTLPR